MCRCLGDWQPGQGVGLLREGRAGLGGSSPRKGQEEGEYSVPSTGLSEEAPIRLFAEVTGRILSHRGELKRQLSAIAYWKTEEVVLFQGAAEDVPKHACDAAFTRLRGRGQGQPCPFALGEKRQTGAGRQLCVGGSDPSAPGREEPFS